MESEHRRRVALVTGGTSVIGAAIVRKLIERHYVVHFTFNKRQAEAIELERQTGASALHLRLEEDNWAPSLPSEIDILVNNVGVNLSGNSVMKTSLAEVKQSMEVNFLGSMKLCQRYLPHMTNQRWGRIVNINSIWGLTSAAERLSYSAAKHALRALTVTLALETASTGITVNEICPGPVDTDMLREMGRKAAMQGRHESVDTFLQSCIDRVPTRRLISPLTIAETVDFLAGDNSSDITGQSLKISGACEF
jgi:3-oxoacyl-[acyl-carrier protein] reductase